MRINKPFDPIEVGEADNFSFDFTYDIGDAVIIAGAMTCSLMPYQTATDPNPQSRILTVQFGTQISVRVAPSGRLVVRNGNFVLARVGYFPATAAGGTYVLEAIATLSDTRVLNLSSTLLCKAPGS